MNKPFCFSFFLCLLCTTLFAQKPPLVSVTADTTKIVLGEQFDLILDARYSDLSFLEFFKVDSISHFEIIAQSKIDTESIGNDVLLSQRITLTSFDSGRWLIPSFQLAGGIRTKPISIEVGFSEFDRNQDYHDVKEIIDVEKPFRSNWYWYLIGAAVLIALFVLLFPNKKKEEKKEPEVDAYKKAMDDLQKIRADGLAEKDVKNYYSSMIDIFRRYLHNRKNIYSYSQTTDDLAVQIKNLQLPPASYNNLVQTLRLSDAVKFAKFIPSSGENAESFDTIKNSIDTIEKG